MISIRPAHVGEATQIATLHAEIWRDTYQDVAPIAAIAKLDAAHRLKTWQNHLSNLTSHQGVLVALNGATIVGFIAFGPPTQTVFEAHGEIKHLYVAPFCKRQKIGQRLIHEAFGQMAKDGFVTAALAVVQSNANARAFYANMQGVEIGSFVDAGPLWKSENIIVAWGIAAYKSG